MAVSIVGAGIPLRLTLVEIRVAPRGPAGVVPAALLGLLCPLLRRNGVIPLTEPPVFRLDCLKRIPPQETTR